MWVLRCALIILDLVIAVSACGIGVHIQILSRIYPHLSPTVQTQSSYSIPGAFFPDAFYSCMGLSEAAEAAHWPPFLHAAASYYHSVYGSDNDLGGAGLRSFLFGQLTHQIADVSWHSLGVDQGLLMAMALREFGGDYLSAHSTLDTGGDFIMMERLLRTQPNLEWLTQRWSIPSRDIRAIFQSMGFSVSRTSLEYCMARGVAALTAEINVAHTMYPSYAKKSKILMDGLEDYFLGGLQEMATSIVKCLKNLDSWLANGPDEDPWSLCQVFAGKAPSTTHYPQFKDSDTEEQEHLHEYASVSETLRPYIDIIMPTLSTHTSPDGETTYIDFPEVELDEENQSGASSQTSFQIGEQKLSQSAAAGSAITLSTGMTASRFGSAFAVGNFRGEDVGPCIAISAPYEFVDETGSNDGAVYVIPLADIESMFLASEDAIDSDVNKRLKQYKLQLPMLDIAHPARRAAVNFTLPRQFGAALTAVTYYNVTLLAVSSPGISTIDIFSGSDHLMSVLPPSQGSTTAYGASGRKLFGTTLTVYDVDKDGVSDLIVSAPESDISSAVKEQGEIMILSGKEISAAITQGVSAVAMDTIRLSRLLRPSGFLNDDQSTFSEISAATVPQFELFGSQVAFTSMTPNPTGSVVGSEIAYIGSEGAGAVFGFDLANGTPLFAMLPQLGVNRTLSGFGGGVLLTGEISGLGEWVLVGSPNESLLDKSKQPRRGKRAPNEFAQTGVCYLYLVRRGADGVPLPPKLLSYIIADSDDMQFGKFGYAGSKVVVANPTSEDSSTSTLQNVVFISSPYMESGAGAVWKISIEDVVYMTSAVESVSTTVCTDKARERLLAAGVKFYGREDLRIDDEDLILSGNIDAAFSVQIMSVRATVQGTRNNRQIESWFGKSIAAVSTTSMSVSNSASISGNMGYLFVGMPMLGFGSMGASIDQQLVGGVSVYPVTY
ncbi:zinc dependent phospholipase C-domain-containing protein [Limtongia smithiae]|uniref:zinc dependent phospholipase C-domain-containing protein n=1 Tax=Limtongia smithiae TaxID=1125753 RepID=UPI0034CD617B